MRAVFIAGLAALAMASPAQADTWHVIGTGDGGTAATPDTHNCPSLRAAIAASEATKEIADIINVPAGVININNDLVIQSDITVNGASARTTIIDGNLKYRGFRVTSTGSAKINHLDDPRRRRGPGRVAGRRRDPELQRRRAAEHRARDHQRPPAEGSGGGIANYQGTLTLVNGLVDNNTAGDGAGIANLGGAETPDRGLLGVATTTIFRNTAGSGGTGGISSRGGQANIVLFNFSTLADNVGGVRGVGGLLIQSGAAQAIGDLIARNTVAGEGIVNCGAVKPTDSGGNLEDDKDCIDAGGGLNPGWRPRCATRAASSTCCRSRRRARPSTGTPERCTGARRSWPRASAGPRVRLRRVRGRPGADGLDHRGPVRHGQRRPTSSSRSPPPSQA